MGVTLVEGKLGALSTSPTLEINLWPGRRGVQPPWRKDLLGSFASCPSKNFVKSLSALVENLLQRKALPPPGAENCAATTPAGAVTWSSGEEEVMKDVSEKGTGAGGGWRSGREPTESLATLEPEAPGAKVKYPPRATSRPRARAPTSCGGQLCGRGGSQGSAPARARAPARSPVRPLGDPASLQRLLEVCKLSSGVPPHHWEAGDAEGGEGPGSSSPLLQLPPPPLDHTSGGTSAPCQVSGGKHTPPIHNCSPCQGNSRALPHTHARCGGHGAGSS
jgi:hypothetical protein